MKKNKKKYQKKIKEFKKKYKEWSYEIYQKINNLNIVVKLIICILVTSITIYGSNKMLDIMDEKEQAYDYSLIQELEGVVVKAYWEKDTSIDYNLRERAYIDIQLPSGEIITKSTGGTLKDKEGDKIIVYTDGEHYELSETGLASVAQDTTIYFLSACLIHILSFIVWTIMFGPKGLIIALLVIVLLFGSK